LRDEGVDIPRRSRDARQGAIIEIERRSMPCRRLIKPFFDLKRNERNDPEIVALTVG
jgi:hypothetical protein